MQARDVQDGSCPGCPRLAIAFNCAQAALKENVIGTQMRLLKQFFTWWNGANWNTLFYTWRKGEHVGTDALGNRYYRAKSAIPDSIPERRWVIYSGYSEASQVPPGWHGWIHHRVDAPPTDAELSQNREWEKPHQENLSGSAKAYRPPGSIAAGGAPARAESGYQAWQPE